MFRDLRVGLWVLFKNYFQANEKQKLLPTHTQKGPCGILSTGVCQFPIRGVNTFRRGGIFVRRKPEKPGDIGRSDIKKHHIVLQLHGEKETD